MNTYQFCIKKDCRTACEAVSEDLAWKWLAETKQLTVEQCKALYKLKLK
tara:strand:+ start:53 stop:199 length:147 start_codon:yes stop_codon:yes gene_type:complete